MGRERVARIKSLPSRPSLGFPDRAFSRALINLFTAIRKHKRTRGPSFISKQTANEYKKCRFRFQHFFPPFLSRRFPFFPDDDGLSREFHKATLGHFYLPVPLLFIRPSASCLSL